MEEEPGGQELQKLAATGGDPEEQTILKQEYDSLHAGEGHGNQQPLPPDDTY